MLNDWQPGTLTRKPKVASNPPAKVKVILGLLHLPYLHSQRLDSVTDGSTGSIETRSR